MQSHRSYTGNGGRSGGSRLRLTYGEFTIGGNSFGFVSGPKLQVYILIFKLEGHRERMGLLSSIAQWRVIMKELVDRTAITVKFLCLLHVTNNYLCSPTHVYGPSMLPTLNLTGDVVLVEHVSPRLGKLGPGDLVLVRSPLNPNRTLTKRIVGLEGDRITYFDPRHGDVPQNAVVPMGHVWIQGDNIYASRDSRHFGPIPYGLIQGKVFFRVWPPDSFGQLDY